MKLSESILRSVIRKLIKESPAYTRPKHLTGSGHKTTGKLMFHNPDKAIGGLTPIPVTNIDFEFRAQTTPLTELEIDTTKSNSFKTKPSGNTRTFSKGDKIDAVTTIPEASTWYTQVNNKPGIVVKVKCASSTKNQTTADCYYHIRTQSDLSSWTWIGPRAGKKVPTPQELGMEVEQRWSQSMQGKLTINPKKTGPGFGKIAELVELCHNSIVSADDVVKAYTEEISTAGNTSGSDVVITDESGKMSEPFYMDNDTAAQLGQLQIEAKLSDDATIGGFTPYMIVDKSGDVKWVTGGFFGGKESVGDLLFGANATKYPYYGKWSTQLGNTSTMCALYNCKPNDLFVRVSNDNKWTKDKKNSTSSRIVIQGVDATFGYSDNQYKDQKNNPDHTGKASGVLAQASNHWTALLNNSGAASNTGILVATNGQPIVDYYGTLKGDDYIAFSSENAIYMLRDRHNPIYALAMELANGLMKLEDGDINSMKSATDSCEGFSVDIRMRQSNRSTLMAQGTKKGAKAILKINGSPNLALPDLHEMRAFMDRDMALFEGSLQAQRQILNLVCVAVVIKGNDSKFLMLLDEIPDDSKLRLSVVDSIIKHAYTGLTEPFSSPVSGKDVDLDMSPRDNWNWDADSPVSTWPPDPDLQYGATIRKIKPNYDPPDDASGHMIFEATVKDNDIREIIAELLLVKYG